MSAVLARRCGRGLLLASLVLPWLVGGGLAPRVEGEAAAAVPVATPVEPVASPAGLGPELVDLRTRTSRTFSALDGGAYSTHLSQSSLNYQTSDGSWLPIDNRFVPAASGGYVNAANSLRYRLPENVSEPVRIENGSDWVSFALVGAKGNAQVTGSKAVYRDALPGVTLTYEGRSDFLKESITVASPRAAGPLRFRVRHSGGLTARKDAKGGIEFVDPQGARRLGFAPPFMFDASGERSSFSRALSVTLTGLSDATELVLTPDPAWLAAPARRWPVTIDPTTGGPYTDCTITSGSGAGTTYCATQTLQVGSDGRINRTLSPWDLSSIPAQGTITQAELRMYLQSASAGVAASIALHRQTRSNNIFATWNTYDGTNAWTSAGGDFVVTPEATNASVGPAPGVYSWYPTKLFAGWHNGTIPNNGMLLKATNEAAANLLTFTSYDAAANEPALWIWWTPQWGRHGYFKFESQSLAERLDISVNVANGNLLVGTNDISVAGTGIDLDLSRTYNGLDANTRRFGRGTSWIAGLVIQQDGGVVYYGDTGEKAHFFRNDDGSYQRPMGFDASLVKNGDGTYTLTDHGSSVKEQFRSDGRLTAIADPNGSQIRFAINANGFPDQITDTQGRTWTLRYNAQNLIDLITESASSRTWAYEYDANGKLITYTNPAGGITRYQYHAGPNFQLFMLINPRGQRTTFTYDPSGRVASVRRETSPGVGPLTEFTYNQGNTVVKDPKGNLTTHYYDSSLRPTRTLDPLGNSVSATYSSNSNVETYSSGSSAVTQNGYDANFNLTSARLPTGATARWEFTDPVHKYLASRAIDGQGNATSMTYDSRTNLTSLTNPASGQAIYTYNSNGTVATARDFKGNLTSFSYDAGGNLTLVDNPAPLGDVTYTYDSLSRVKTTTDGKSQTTTFAYDALDRVTNITYSGGATITYGYDANGNRSGMTDNTGTTNYGYDVLNRLTSEVSPTSNVRYTYDAAGNLASFDDLNAVGDIVTYGYNAANLLTTLTQQNGQQITFTYDADQIRTQTNYPNGVSMFFSYDQSNRLTRVLGKKPASGEVLTDFVYSWTNGSGPDTGMRQSVTDKNGNRTAYTYDVLNRLVLAEERSSTNVLLNRYAYAYDANSNRTSQTVNGVTTTYAHNAADQLTTAGSTTYSYDANGNELSNSAGRAWSYNAKDQAVSVTPPGGSAIPMSYTGTGQFERVSAGSTTYDTSALGLTRENLDGYIRDDAGLLLFRKTPGNGDHYYLLDGLGSVVALTNSLGTLAGTYSYEPFGKLKSSTGTVTNPYRWLGGLGVYFDTTTGLYKMGARYYDPVLGRFTQTDPVPGGAANRYDYAAQDPINNVDPAGTVCGPGALGGTSAFDFAFATACRNHDRCYGNWHPRRTRLACDRAFLGSAVRTCYEASGQAFATCLDIAWGYYRLLRRRGVRSFAHNQYKACPFRRGGGRDLFRCYANIRARMS